MDVLKNISEICYEAGIKEWAFPLRHRRMYVCIIQYKEIACVNVKDRKLNSKKINFYIV